MNKASEAAAMWGLAQNQTQLIGDRLSCALQALEFFGGYYEDVEHRDWLLDQIAGHSFEQVDTGITKCAHPEHLSGPSHLCWKSFARQALDKRKEEV